MSRGSSPSGPPVGNPSPYSLFSDPTKTSQSSKSISDRSALYLPNSVTRSICDEYCHLCCTRSPIELESGFHSSRHSLRSVSSSTCVQRLEVFLHILHRRVEGKRFRDVRVVLRWIISVRNEVKIRHCERNENRLNQELACKRSIPLAEIPQKLVFLTE